jgi:putative MATE family efflux protein
MRPQRTYVTEGPIGPTLLRMTLPMVAGIMTMMLFNVVDTFFVSLLGPIPLAAIGFTFPVVFIITGTTMGMGIGMASVVSRAVGSGDHKVVAETATRGLLFVVLLVLLFVAVGLLLHDPVFRLLGANEELIGLIRQYMIPWFLGVPFLVIPMIGNSAIRATGDSLTPSLIIMTAGVVNIVLDPLLIFGIGPFPRLELQGAAVATVISYGVTFCAALWVLIRREKMIVWEIPPLAGLLETWRRLLYVGLPAVLTNLLIPLSGGILTRIMASYGPHAVAAFGVCSRIESLVMVGAFAMTTIMVPFAGQNFGAGKADRVMAGLRFGLRYCLCISFVVWVILALAAETIAGWFADDPEIIKIILPFLRWVPLSYGAFGYMLLVTATFNGGGHPGKAMLLFGSRLFIFTVPLALLGSHWGGIPGVFVAMFAGNVLAGLFAQWMNLNAR